MSNIIRITIDSASSPFSTYSYADRLEVSHGEINYVKGIENSDTYEWSYKTASTVYQKKFELVIKLLKKYFKKEDMDIPDGISAFTIYLLYDNGDILEKSFPLTFEDNGMEDVMFLLKDMIPSCEDLPEYFLMDACPNPLLDEEEIE